MGGQPVPSPATPIPRPAFWAWLMVAMMASTSLAVASIQPWLVAPYLFLVSAIVFAPALERSNRANRAERSEPDSVKPETDVPEADRTLPAGPPDVVPILPEPAPAKRRRGRAKARPKADAAAAETAMPEPTWVRVGPGKFVRIDGPTTPAAGRRGRGGGRRARRRSPRRHPARRSRSSRSRSSSSPRIRSRKRSRSRSHRTPRQTLRSRASTSSRLPRNRRPHPGLEAESRGFFRSIPRSETRRPDRRPARKSARGRGVSRRLAGRPGRDRSGAISRRAAGSRQWRPRAPPGRRGDGPGPGSRRTSRGHRGHRRRA